MKNLLTLIAGMLVFVSAEAQDPNFSQFYNNPVYYNPGMTAINNGMSFRANARNLWGPIPGRFNTFSGSFEAQTVYKMGLGGFAYSDVAGEALLRTSAAYLTYSYRPVDTKNLIIQAGVAGGFVSKNVDWSRLTFSDQLDETLGNIYQSSFTPPSYNRASYADFSTGLVARFNGKTRRSSGAFRKLSATVGAAAHHLSEPKDALLGDKERLPMRFVFHGTVNMLLNENIYSPGIVFEQQNMFRTFSIGMNFVNRPMTFGVWFRNRTAAMSFQSYDSFTFNIGLNMPPKRDVSWKVMYGFDMTISRLKTSSYGTHEISLVFDLEKSVLFQAHVRKKALRRRFQCPDDFRGYI